MAKVIGQDIPSKYYDTYNNFFSRSYNQRHQKYGGTVKRSNWDFPGYPFHPHFPSPGQLYVRAIFKSATECWHLQPDVGKGEKPDLGPIPKAWWEAEADKSRTFGYRKFMRDTLLYKFRIGEPTWCEEIIHPFTYVDYDNPHTNYCTVKSMRCTNTHWNGWEWVFIQRHPFDVGKEFLWLHASDAWYYPDHHNFIDACLPFHFVFYPCELTWDDLDQGSWPFFWLHMSRNYIHAEGWYRFYVADIELVALMIYYPDWPYFPWLEDSGIIFDSPLCDDPELRPFFSHE